MLHNYLIDIYNLLDNDKPNIIRGAMKADFEEVKAALKENPACITEADPKTGLTALHIACGEGNLMMVDLLCDQPDYDILKLDGWGRSPLYMAVAIGDEEILERLSRDSNEHARRTEEVAAAENVTILRPNPNYSPGLSGFIRA